MLKTLKLFFSASCGIGVFAGFIMLVGSSHYIETIVGLCLGGITFVWLYWGKKIREIMREF